MAFTLDNQTLLYILIVLFVVQLFIMRYYVQSSIEENNNKNNKKVIKKLTGQISATFDQYMGGNRHLQEKMSDEEMYRKRTSRRDDIDSIEDPAENVEGDDDDVDE